MTANKKLPNRRSGKGADGPMAQMVDFIQENWKTIVIAAATTIAVRLLYLSTFPEERLRKAASSFFSLTDFPSEIKWAIQEKEIQDVRHKS